MDPAMTLVALLAISPTTAQPLQISVQKSAFSESVAEGLARELPEGRRRPRCGRRNPARPRQT